VREGLSRPLWLALVIAAFCLPLFIGLGRTDVENDEGIYSFAVDQILANGDWLNPRASPQDDLVFLEKPPLKFWIVAAPIRLGLLPLNEFGLRFWDALFAAVAFLYVFTIGQRLAGPLCGVIAVMVLFVYDPLLFEHGVRGNNMEGPLFLCYCGGIYHYIAWGTQENARRRFRHIVGVSLYFFLGFMTKFVAALFLPVTLGAASLVLPVTRRRLRADLPRWFVGAAIVLGLSAPWFIYQQIHVGNALWGTMFGIHVFMRFTSSVDPSHVHAWSYYYAVVFGELTHTGTVWLAVCGTVLLLWTAWRQRSVEAVTVLVWMLLPLALMSIGTSKLHHYAYPFVPPLALAAGFAPAWLFRVGRDRVEALMQRVHAFLGRSRPLSGAISKILLGLAFVALGVAVATFMLGNLNWRIAGVQILRNSHVVRPLILALVLATLGGHGVAAARLLFPTALLLLVLPGNAYEDTFRHLQLEAHPLRSVSECGATVRRAELSAGRQAPGVYSIGEHRWFLHSYYYYLHRLGGWERTDTADPVALERALFEPGHQRPVMIDDASYRAFKADHGDALRAVPVVPLREVLLLMPGPYAVCGPNVTTRAAQPR
jgi:4-amino-4-deoxy-L-arabinose transferase-like glycosyltransferase